MSRGVPESRGGEEVMKVILIPINVPNSNDCFTNEEQCEALDSLNVRECPIFHKKFTGFKNKNCLAACKKAEEKP